MERYTIFETHHGFAAIGWNGEAITSFRLPSNDAREAERSALRRRPGAARGEPPAAVSAVITDAKRYFEGVAGDFASAAVDLGVQEPLFARIYGHVRALGRGETTTYGAIAKALGVGPEAARDVGVAMARNPVPLIIPCHRVLGAGGKIGGFSAPGGSDAKARMLELEGVETASTSRPATATQLGFGF